MKNFVFNDSGVTVSEEPYTADEREASILNRLLYPGTELVPTLATRALSVLLL